MLDLKFVRQFIIIPALLLVLVSSTIVFAQGNTTGTVIKNANLRAGPGTTYAIVGGATAGQVVTIVGKNDKGDWYHLDGDQWIAAFLVNVGQEQSANPTAPPNSSQPAPTATPQQTGTPKVVISYVFYDGEVYRTEDDEYAVITNTGNAPQNLGGWLLNAGDPYQDFRFPNYTLNPGASVRVYTNEVHPETGGFSFGIGRAIWNNQGDCGYLYDTGNNEVAEYCY